MQLMDALADVLLGASCPGCDTAAWGLCRACEQALEVAVQPAARFAGLPIVAANTYRPILEHTIPRYKDDGALHLEGCLSSRLTRAVAALAPDPATLLVPVPSRPSAIRARGFDHGARLAAAAAKALGLRSRKLLRRRDRGSDQQGLGLRERANNVAGTMFACRPAGGAVVLVDDIVTTGASLREAATTLTDAGITVIGAAVIASADH